MEISLHISGYKSVISYIICKYLLMLSFLSPNNVLCQEFFIFYGLCFRCLWCRQEFCLSQDHKDFSCGSFYHFYSFIVFNTGILIHSRWECRMIEALWKTVEQFHKMLSIKWTQNPLTRIPGIHPRQTKPCPYKNLYTNVYSNIIHNCPKLKIIQKSLNEWINSDFSHTMKYDSIIKRNKLFRYAVMQLNSQIHHAKWKNTVSKMYILYDFIYMIFWGKGKQ